jgi:hypothetical protein
MMGCILAMKLSIFAPSGTGPGVWRRVHRGSAHRPTDMYSWHSAADRTTSGHRTVCPAAWAYPNIIEKRTVPPSLDMAGVSIACTWALTDGLIFSAAT